MAIILKEYLNYDFSESTKIAPVSMKESFIPQDALTMIDKDSIMVDIEGIHVGPTENYTWYTEQALKSSIESWTKPYEKPLILHHNDENGITVGRVLAAEYKSTQTRSGTGALVFTCNVSDEECKKGVLDGRLKTTSIGASATDVRCSICGHNLADDGLCEHERGRSYDGEICYWMIYEMKAKELSYVIIPSDNFAHNIKVYGPESFSKELCENKNNEKGVIKMKESQSVKEEALVEKGEITEIKTENDNKEVNEDMTKEKIEKLDKIQVEIEELKSLLKIEKAKVVEAEKLRESVEEELIAANVKVRELATEQIGMLRESLNKPELSKECLMKRTQESLLDSIYDLKEEAKPSIKNKIDVIEGKEQVIEKVAEVKESAKEEAMTDESKVSEVSEIKIVESTGLVDKDKDSLNEEKKELDVKENVDNSNTFCEIDLNEKLDFYLK